MLKHPTLSYHVKSDYFQCDFTGYSIQNLEEQVKAKVHRLGEKLTQDTFKEITISLEILYKGEVVECEITDIENFYEILENSC